MTHIPHDRILPQDLVDMHDHGPAPAEYPNHGPLPADTDHATKESRHRVHAAYHTAMVAHHAWKQANPKPVLHRMHVTDAKQAMHADPERWTLAGELPPHKRAEADNV